MAADKYQSKRRLAARNFLSNISLSEPFPKIDLITGKPQDHNLKIDTNTNNTSNVLRQSDNARNFKNVQDKEPKSIIKSDIENDTQMKIHSKENELDSLLTNSSSKISPRYL